MGEPPRRGEHFGGALASLQTPTARSRSFAELVAALNELNRLESSLATAIAHARVPVQEVRTLLRAQTALQAENAPAFQFMREMFAQVGIPLAMEAVGRFTMRFGVEASAYARLFAGDAPRKTCDFVSEAIARFLGSDFGLPAQVREAVCRNDGGTFCVFEADLNPEEVAARALDDLDWRLFKAIAQGASPPAAARSLRLPDDERDYRMESLIGFGLLTSDGRLLPGGDALLRVGAAPVEERFEPPWRDASRLTEAIATAASAAEALVEVAPQVPGREMPPDAETTALAAECHSFAELLARASKGRTWE
ncbi:MAG: hypothetical protein E6K18_03575 [Methanobacteriota archaeon]|nr:MAG: hypothetical protein E6K18_03575 [Euryarchaeota archaeon]